MLFDRFQVGHLEEAHSLMELGLGLLQDGSIAIPEVGHGC